jgi:isoleucyl-tRNA synthetase
MSEQVTQSMEKYELDRAARPILEFIDDLSTWYVRRSRDRFKENSADKNVATKTMAYVLLNTSKIIAPFMPFLAEDIYQRITNSNYSDPNKSVHLTDWPKLQKSESKPITEMAELREVVTNALEARDKDGIKVRQPLAKLFVSEKIANFKEDLRLIIQDEVNVKSIDADKTLSRHAVKLETDLTPELISEGVSRELIRFIQSLRKKAGLNPQDKIKLNISTDQEGQKIVNNFKSDISETANISEIFFREDSSEKSEVLETDKYKFEVDF